MPDNVQIVREGYAAFNRRDWDGVRAGWAPEVEWHQYTEVPDRTTFRGPDEVIEMFLIGQWVSQFPLRFSHLYRLRDGKVFEVHDVAAGPRRSGWSANDPS